jgi:thioredoxin-dependent peroxiredoxin
VDSPEVNKKFAQSLSVDYPILSDPEKRVAKAYGVVHGIRLWPERWTFYIGKDGKILYVDKKIKTQSAGEDVSKKLKELGVEASR